MNRVEELILQALTTANDNQMRAQAEKTIFAIFNENPSDFFLTCTNIVVSEGKSESIRRSAGTVMKALLGKRVLLPPFRRKTGSFIGTWCPLTCGIISSRCCCRTWSHPIWW